MKKCLIVVDYQKDFVDGSLGFSGAELLDEKISSRIILARENGEDVIFTFDTHTEQYLETQEGKNLPVKHCILNTEGHELYGNTAKMKAETDKCFNKYTFGSLDLANYLAKKEYGEVELCGLVSNICVLSNCVLAKAALPEAKIIVNRELTDSFDKQLNDYTINVLRGIQVEVL